ncbi:MAG: beta-ketoacyl synthase chain length factor [Verrucomicrobiales bacterium]|nr:beta-ketoacyl synthase chain length factor [Verrucomicrobiales bacterium]
MPTTPHIAISGFGAVSPAGWTAADLNTTSPVDTTTIEIPGAAPALVRRVPKPPAPLPFARHPRRRRVSPNGRFATAAAIEAVGSGRDTSRLGVICTVMNACVNYSHRFFREVLEDPSTASPILFPETVFNAPSSHLSAYFGSTAPNNTIVHDSSGFIAGLDLAAAWLTDRQLDACLVVCAEETDPLSAQALSYFDRHAIPAEGAAAILLEATATPPAIELTSISTTASASPLATPPIIGNTLGALAGLETIHALQSGRTTVHVPTLPDHVSTVTFKTNP